MTRSPLGTRRHFGRVALAVDGAMMALLVLNLTWLLFDSALRGSITLRLFLREHLAHLYDVYETTIHDNFVLVDAAFVSVFVVELSARWAVAVKRRTYHRWFFYPIIHWYDVLGCIPIGSMRFLRILRLFAMAYRMQRLGLIDVTKLYPYRVLVKYKEILSEEISDRVVLRVLTGVQEEVKHGAPVIERIWKEALIRDRQELSARIVDGTEALVRRTLDAHQPALHAYVDRVLTAALGRSQYAFHTLHGVPVFGRMVIGQIEDAIRIIVNNVIAELLDDARTSAVQPLATEIERAVTEVFAERDLRIESIVQRAVHQSLEIIKDQVRVQQWKLHEPAEDAVAARTPRRVSPEPSVWPG